MFMLASLTAGVSPVMADGARQIAAGSGHACAVTAAGGVACWGDNADGQLGDGTTTDRSTPTAVIGLTSVVTGIAEGGYHSCALTTGGGVVCWGRNVKGQLGEGTTTNRLTPTAVSGLESGVTAVAAGQNHTCALTTAGGVVCWGDNYYGQLGDGTTTQRLTPTPVSGLTSGVTAVAAGGTHTCALTSGGGVVCWGQNWNGQLGDGTTTNRATPASVSDLASGVTAITTGYYHACALTASGDVRCWGDNYYGQLGDGTRTRRTTPTAVTGLASGVVAVAGGHNHNCALTASRGVQCWGNNDSGQLGDGTTTWRSAPTPVTGLSSGVAAITGGYHHTCALTASGGVRCWGNNDSGQLGDGTTTWRSAPTPLNRLASGVAAITTGSYHACALTTAGGVVCWGSNSSGQLGDGTTISRPTPTAVSGLATGVTAIAAGWLHTCALTTAGGVVCWGYNSSGQLGDGSTTSRLTPTPVNGLAAGVSSVAAGTEHTCALTTAGGVVCWGAGYHGELGDGTTTSRRTPTAVSGLQSGVAAITAGSHHNCALTAGGGVLCWGSNHDGALGDGTMTDRSTPTAVSGLSSGITAVAAGYAHTCVVTAEGGAGCWGDAIDGLLGDGAPSNYQLRPTSVSGLLTGVAGVAASPTHTCALTAAGGVLCWGHNYRGGLGDGTTATHVTPTGVLELGGDVVGVAAGTSYTCAVTSGGSVSCWGDDSSGQLGLGTRHQATSPVEVYGFAGAIAAGSVTPARGATGGGTSLTILGAYFLQGATVTVGGVPATGVVVVNTETITATTGPHASGTTDVVVRNPDGTTATLTRAFTYGSGGGNTRGDFTGDARADVLWRHTARGEVWLWPMNGAARTAESYVRTVSDTNWEIRGQGDQTGDGKADILWRHKTTGAIYLWPMNGSTPLSETYVGTVDPAYDIVGTGDFNGDGKSDILWRHLTNGEVWIWLMDGPAPLSTAYVDRVDTAYAVKGVGDLDGDGKADIVWHHATLGEVWVWRMDGTARLAQSFVGTVADTDYQVQDVVDFTGDGKADLLWHHATRGEVWIWTMNGPALVSETWVGTVPDAGYRIAATGDYDGDGKADILWRHAARGEVWQWLMSGTTKLSESWVGTVSDVGYQVMR